MLLVAFISQFNQLDLSFLRVWRKYGDKSMTYSRFFLSIISWMQVLCD